MTALVYIAVHAQIHAGGCPAGKQLCRKGPGSAGGHQLDPQPATWLWGKRREMIPWAAFDKALSAGWGRWSFPSAQHWWSRPWSPVASSRLRRETWTYIIQRSWMEWSISPVRKGWESSDCSTWRREGSGGPHQHIYTPEGRVQRQQNQALSSGAIDRTRANGHTGNIGGSFWTSGNTFPLQR